MTFAAFFIVESRAAEPILPLHVFKVRNFSVASGMSFLLGLAMLGALTFLPLYQQTVQHLSPTGSGLALIPMMLGATTTSLISGQFTSKTGRYKVLPVIGAVIMTVGLYLLTHLGQDTSTLKSAGYFVIFGLGMGFLMQITSLIVQNSVPQSDMGVASSSRAFFQQIGGSIGVSLFGAIFIKKLNETMAARLPGAHLSASNGQFDPATINSLPTHIRDAAFYAISHAVDAVFWWAIPATVLVLVLAVSVKEIPLRGRTQPAIPQPTAERTEPADMGAV
jgi:MFS family permease